MQLHSFKNDYSEGCHPAILQALIDSNLIQEEGYGNDSFSLKAVEMIREAVGNTDAGVYFMPIGTQTNLTVISSILKSYEYVIAAETGHIVGSEAGAIEATGHKVVTLPTQVDGKIRLSDLHTYFDAQSDHPLFMSPRLLYISNSTELGAIYTKAEIEELSNFCHEKNMFLFLDGARLASALTAEGNDVTLKDLAELVDIFYIGATKAGGLIGEAVVISEKSLETGFAMNMKQKGAVLAKGRLLGIQFVELFKDNLYFEMAKHANKMAKKISDAIRKKGFHFLTESNTNQLFPILPNDCIQKLHEKYAFYTWKNINAKESAIRLITCWATKEESVDELIADIESL